MREKLEQRTGRGAFGNSLRNRKQGGIVDAFDGALGGGVEIAQALEFIAEEFRADGEFLARTPSVDDSAADRVVACLFHRRNAIIADFREFFADISKTNGDSPRRFRRFCGDSPRRNPLKMLRKTIDFKKV